MTLCSLSFIPFFHSFIYSPAHSPVHSPLSTPFVFVPFCCTCFLIPLFVCSFLFFPSFSSLFFFLFLSPSPCTLLVPFSLYCCLLLLLLLVPSFFPSLFIFLSSTLLSQHTRPFALRKQHTLFLAE
ncbi:MAG: hypothetical protein J3R72DRAFT_447013 [Linnemannia gamsii]|nr:MAG: hypothetical protein J3R72DRAFT_447013 [Linnemannia gamsii]